MDSAYTGLTWSLNIPALARQTLEDKKENLSEFVSSISEVLSPIEKLSFDLIYHSPDSRREASIVAERVFRHLSSHSQPNDQILHWLKSGLFNDLGLEKNQQNSQNIEKVAEIKLRSHFARVKDRPVKIEHDLVEMGFTHASVLAYKAWNSSVSIEPDEMILDVLSENPYSSNSIGKIILWVMSRIDKLDALANDTFSIYSKNDTESLYLSLLTQAIKLKFPGFEFQVIPWQLQDFKLFPETGLLPAKGSIWAADSRLSSPISKHIFSNRRKNSINQLYAQYEELVGLRKLYLHLKDVMKKTKAPHRRYLIFTSSVKIYKDSKALIEFDGGLVQISTNDGKLTWHGLETKTGKENPMTSLQKRVNILGLQGKIYKLDKRTAVFETSL